jgi:hypothetical protein
MSSRTVKSPKSHIDLAYAYAGDAYGHVPGHQYHDVDVLISQGKHVVRVQIVESWGSAQGYDQEHGRKTVTARGDTIRRVAADAERMAVRAGMADKYLVQALSAAIDEAEELALAPVAA